MIVSLAHLPLSRYRTTESFEIEVSKFAINGAIYCVAANHECTYSPVYKNPPEATVMFRMGWP